MDFLALARSTRQWSSVSSAAISTVVNQTGKELDIVDAVNIAWGRIQNLHSTWNWMRAEFSAPLTAVTPPAEARYTAASFGITRFRDWVRDIVGGPNSYRAFSLYLTATGLSDEAPIAETSFELWKNTYGRGVVEAKRPKVWAKAPDRRFCLGHPPDAAYTLKGEYWMSNQTLAEDDDEPEMPEDYHMAIVWLAVQILTEKDESAQDVYERAQRKYDELIFRLERDELPSLEIGGRPLA